MSRNGRTAMLDDSSVPPTLAAPATFIPRELPLPRWKRAMDLAGASLALVLLSPLFLALVVLVRLDSRGPAFFGQRRIGVNGRPFICWKFRSMCENAEQQLELLAGRNDARGQIFKLRDDPRRTRVGRLLRRSSLDELPQLWNVLRGEMSLVGPRPPLPSEVARYEPHCWVRLRGTPGMTGLWQIRARHRHDFDEMVRLDAEYFDHLSLGNDLKILLLTIPVVLSGRGAH